MKGDPKVITCLHQALKSELIAVNQYFLRARMYRKWGLSKLGDHEDRDSIHEMKHADKLIERVLFPDGLPDRQDLGKLLVGENPQECIERDLTPERTAREAYREAIAYRGFSGEYVTREILDGIQVETEEHIDWPEPQSDLIDRVGLQNDLQSQMWRLVHRRKLRETQLRGEPPLEPSVETHLARRLPHPEPGLGGRLDPVEADARAFDEHVHGDVYRIIAVEELAHERAVLQRPGPVQVVVKRPARGADA